jgi:3-oxoadipate enol-lactonase
VVTQEQNENKIKKEENMKTNKRPFKYKTFGEGSPVLLIPGLDGITEFFADIYPALSPKYKVIKYFLPLLDEAKDKGVEYTFDFIAADIKGCLDELGIEKTHIIGESFGGAVAMTFALNYPDMLDKLVVLSSAPRFDLSLKVKLQLSIFPFVPMWLFARVHLYEVCERNDPKWMKEMFIRNATWADHKTVVKRAQIASTFNIMDRVSTIKVPTLIMMGGTDQFTNKGSEMLHEKLENSKIVVIEGYGHLCHVIAPEKFVENVVRHFE